MLSRVVACFLMMFAPLVTLAAATAVQEFQTIEQSLMNAVTAGDRTPWVRVLDADCVLTTEEGQLLTREAFLQDLRPLPPGLAGTIVVRDLTVQDRSDVAIVRFVADESETVFGQRLSTKYRVTDTFRRSAASWRMIASVITADPPRQNVSTDAWPGLVGAYQLVPDGWIFHVELRGGMLYGGRDPAKLRPPMPLNADVVRLARLARRMALRRRARRQGVARRRLPQVRAVGVDANQVKRR